MTDMKPIHDFAVKWCDKFRDQNINYMELVDHWMADDCAALGFVMDCGHGGERCEKARSKNFKIEKVATDRLFGAIAAYFGNEYKEIFATDIGNWVMELTNTEGTVYKFRGSLCADFDYEGTDLSDLVRDTVGMDDLYVFDGNCKPDVINRITLDYHRVTKNKT